jgi:voltage-gated potassium channel
MSLTPNNQASNALDKPLPSAIITSLIVLSVVFYSIETLPDLKGSTRQLLRYFEITIVSVFTIEYFYRIYTSERRLKFIFSFYGLIDLLAILPFYLSTAIDLRSLRLMRLLRLVRILKLARYNRAITRFSKAVNLVKEELIIFTLASLVLIFLSAVGIYHFEHNAQPEVFKSIFDSMWWAVASLTTVGYGDIYPITIGGRIFTFIVLMVGLGLVAVPTGIVASALSEVRKQNDEA